MRDLFVVMIPCPINNRDMLESVLNKLQKGCMDWQKVEGNDNGELFNNFPTIIDNVFTQSKEGT